MKSTLFVAFLVSAGCAVLVNSQGCVDPVATCNRLSPALASLETAIANQDANQVESLVSDLQPALKCLSGENGPVGNIAKALQPQLSELVNSLNNEQTSSVLNSTVSLVQQLRTLRATLPTLCKTLAYAG